MFVSLGSTFCHVSVSEGHVGRTARWRSSPLFSYPSSGLRGPVLPIFARWELVRSRQVPSREAAGAALSHTL